MKGIVFDLDGTLIDSLPSIAWSLNAALTEQELPTHSVASIRSFIGDGADTLISRAVHGHEEKAAAVLDSFRRIYSAHMTQDTVIYPGMLELLEKLHAAGYQLAVLSNKPHAYTVEIVAEMFPPHLFTHVIGDREGYARKPEPRSLLEIISAWKFQAEDCAMVGDSAPDISAALAASVLPIAVTWGYHDVARLAVSNKKIIVCKNAQELASVIC